MSVYRHQGKWMYDFQKNKVRQKGSGYNTKQEARDAEADARKKLKMMNSDFISLCESRLRDLKERRTEQYFKENELLIKKLILRWGTKKVIYRGDVEQYLSERLKKSSNVTANKELRMIKALFGHGIDHEMLNDNPCKRIKLFPVSHKKKYIPPKEDIEKVLMASSPENRRYLMVIIHTLARVNEINKLKWEDVYDEYLILRTRKAKNSDLTERKIAINDTLRNVLKGIPKIGEYVFCYKANKKPYLRRLKTIKAACKKAGVKEFGYHALRHYGASKLAAEGIPLTDIQAILGHQKATTTNIYLQSISTNLKKAMDKIGIESPI